MDGNLLLGSLLNIIQIKKETPDAVGYQVFGPVVYNPPKELLDNLSTADRECLSEIKTWYVTIDNVSSNTQKNIRVIYSGDIGLNPEVESQSRDVPVDFESNQDKKEIIVKEILPDDSIIISIHNANDDFKVNNVLIEDKMVTTTMQKLAEAKRRPSLMWLYIVLTLSVGATAYSVISTKNKLDEQRKIDTYMEKFYDKLGYGSCTPSIFENSIGKEKELERAYKKLSTSDQANTLKFNDVDSYEQLKVQDEVLFCKFKK